MTIFQSSKNYVTVSLLWLTVIFLLLILFLTGDAEDVGKESLIGIIILYVITGMLIWILADTNYKIGEKKLFYASGPIRGCIKIAEIRKIEPWNKWYLNSFIKPALDKDGMIIHYNKFEDIYISPKEKEKFIAVLREINPDIEVV